MQNKRFYLYIILVAVLYATQYYINNKITPVGDQTAFLNYAKAYHHQYWQFGIERYFTWSSRLLIESFTLLFSVHEKLFLVSSIVATVLLLLPSRHLVPKAPWLPGILIFIFFPASEFLSAGSIPTYTNYIFPASFLVFSFYFRDSKQLWVRILALLSFIFSMMQEQLAVFAFLWMVFTCIENWQRKKINLMVYSYTLLSFLGILSARLSPGNSVRLSKEITSWFPTFPNMTVFQKVGLGILETGDGLLSVSFIFVFLFLIVLLVLSVYKRNMVSLSISGFVLLTIISQKMEWRNLGFTLSAISQLSRDSGTFEFNLVFLGGVTYYSVIFLLLSYALWNLVEGKDRVWLTYLFLIGVIGRMLISFSPTLYASNTRTYLPVMISLFLITCHLVNEIYNQMVAHKVSNKELI